MDDTVRVSFTLASHPPSDAVIEPADCHRIAVMRCTNRSGILFSVCAVLNVVTSKMHAAIVRVIHESAIG